MWRVSYSVQTIARILRREPVDIGVYAFFMLFGHMREKIFRNYFLIRRFLQKFNMGTMAYENDRVRLTVADLVFFLPVRGFEQGDFFDIVVPYIEIRRPELRIEIQRYMKTNLERFLDGPYLNDFCGLEVGDTVIDAGACDGLFSVIASRLVGEEGRVYAFEPITEALEMLKENVKQNSCDNVVTVPFALGEENSMVEMNVNLKRHFEGSSKYLERGGERRKVRQVTLDSFIADQGIGAVGFIKADIEGAERDLLVGARETIMRHKPNIAIRSYHRPDDPKVLSGMLRSYVPDYEIRQLNHKMLYARVVSAN